EELFVRPLTPEEEGEARGELEIGEALRRGRALCCRNRAQQELRARQDGGEPAFDARLEVAGLPAHPVERERCFQILVRGRATERERGEARQDALRAGQLLGFRLRPADEDPPAALRFA